MDDQVEHSIFCWGSDKSGQLGSPDNAGATKSCISLPTLLKTFQGYHVAEIVTGRTHTLFRLTDGSVWSCGNNERGQLGRETTNHSQPGCVSHLTSQFVKQIGCGEFHSVALTDTGQVFSWGINSGQLGRGYSDQTHIPLPKLVRNLSSSCVVQVACGSHHTLALTDNGSLYSWGMNGQGQLGIGAFSSKCDSPQLISSLAAVPIRCISCGSSSSYVVTKSGALFSWGSNSYGQLGNGDEKNRFFPTQCKSLRNQRVVHVTSGNEHTAVLTQDGGVFTFGCGLQGQLGQNSTKPDLLPRKVFELMGSVVTQLAAGHSHTLAYVASSGRLYSFGCGSSGQLGTGSDSTRLSPSLVRGPFIPHIGRAPAGLPDLEEAKSYVLTEMFAGGDQSFVTASKPQCSVAPHDHRLESLCQQIITLSCGGVGKLVAVKEDTTPQPEQLEEVEKLFSSVSSLNASFLLSDDEHFCCNSKNAGVDMDAARNVFGRLRVMHNTILKHWIQGTIEKDLIASLPESPPHVEAMRIYLSLPWCHLFDNPTAFDTVICPFGQAILALQAVPTKILELWWSKCNSEYFTRILDVNKQTVWHVLCMESPQTEEQVRKRQSCLRVCMELLKKLNRVNEENNHIIPYDSFYMCGLDEKVNIRADYINWLQQSRNSMDSQALIKGNLLSFCHYPFVFDAEAKTQLLRTDALLQMQIAVDEAARRNFSTMFNFGAPIDPVNPCLVLYVTRDNIVTDTIAQLEKQKAQDFKKPLKIIFLGEDAIDEGGVRKEFFLLLIREILDPKYGMFVYYEESRLIWFTTQTWEELTMYALIGVVCGLAIYNGLIVDLPFPLALYKKVLSKSVMLGDLAQIEPCIGRSLQQLIDYTEDDLQDVFSLNFQVTQDVYGERKQLDLIPGGADVHVNQENKQQYADSYLDYFFNWSVKVQFSAFNEGFHRVAGGRILELFQAKELQEMVVGNENYDWEVLEKNCEYKGEFYRQHPTISFFWEVFHELTLEQQKKFLMFLTGSDRIPIHGMKVLKMFIQPVGGGETFLPVAHTCFNLLDLPKYSTKPVLREKLILAIQHCKGFGIV